MGANGTGKTTLLKILIGEETYDNGDIFKHKIVDIGYMEQYLCSDKNKSIWDESISVFSHLIDLEKEIQTVNKDIENKNGDIDTLVRRQHSLSEQYEKEGGFLYRSKVRAMLLGLGFLEDEFNLPIDVLSGGQKTRVLLGKMLLSKTNLLLLDEPTNYLDIASIEWLENYLINYSGAFIIISHDRYFLDKVTYRTFEIEIHKLTVYNGNYSYYIKKKEEDKLIALKHYNNVKKEITRIERIVEQQRRWNREKNIKTAESKEKAIKRLQEGLEKPTSEEDSIKFDFTARYAGGNDVLIANDIAKSFDDKDVLQNINLHIRKRERVFLLGPNGSGKTTLFKIIIGEYESDKGEYELGSNIEIGYYDQTQSNLNYDKTVFDEIRDTYPEMTNTNIRNALASFLFKGDDVFKEISVLSGGERARVALLKLMLSQDNFLLLDEPTNHLDISSCEMLEDALMSYEGTIFVISHDRYFINKMADRILKLTPNGLQEYLGNYDYYIEKSQNNDVIIEEKKAPKVNDYKVRKEREATKRRLLKKIEKTEQEININEEKIKKLKEQLHTPEYATDYLKALEITNEITKLKQKVDILYESWEDLQDL